MNLWLVFLTGLTTGGLSCLAVQGGLLAGVIAQQKHREIREGRGAAVRSGYPAKLRTVQASALNRFDQLDWLPVAMFLFAKLCAHLVLGFFLGWLGSLFVPSPTVQLFFQAFTGVFMLIVALNLLNVHPIFRHFMIQPPKPVQRLIRGQSKSSALFAPAVLGLLTVFIPCGVTQAMEVLAINSGNPVQGALIMGVFVLGTVPVFAGIGITTARLAESWTDRFLRAAAYALVVMAIYSLNGVLVVLNSPVTLQTVTRPISYFFSAERFANTQVVPITAGVQRVSIAALNTGYSPNFIRVRAGLPVELTISTNETYSCAVAFQFPEFGIKTFLEPVDTQMFTFTPTKRGRYTYTCSMGMYTGTLEVI